MHLFTYLFDLHLDVDRYACRHLKSLKRINGLLCGSDDVDQSLVSSLLELLTAVLIFMYSAEDRNNLLLCGQRNGAAHLGSGLCDRVDDLLRGRIHELVIICLQGNSHNLICHKKSRLLIRTF